MATVLLKKKNAEGGVLGFEQITLLENMRIVTGTGKEKAERTYFLADCDGELMMLAADDIYYSFEDYKLAKK